MALRIEPRDLYASSTPIFAATGEGIALLEARLPASESDAEVAGVVRRLGWTAFLLSVAAVAAALLLARRIVRPLQSVAESATRLGRGDFSASIPVEGGGPEVVALARTLEDMRRHLVELTATLRRREADAQAMLRGVVEGVYAVDANRNVKYLNPQAELMLGARPPRPSAGSAATCSGPAHCPMARDPATQHARSSPRASTARRRPPSWCGAQTAPGAP